MNDAEDDDIPVVLPAIPVEPPPRPRPRPGFLEGALLTLAFAAVLFGAMIAFLVAGVIAVVVQGGPDAMKAPVGAEPGSLASVPPALLPLLAWSFPIGYAAGFAFAVLMCRLVIGRGWTRAIGLRRLPPRHLILAVAALPGFVVVSDLIGGLLFDLFGMKDFQEQTARELVALFGPFHWSFVVLAIGVGPGLVEELWCRGFLGRGFVGRYGWVGGVALTSLFFGCLHLYPPPYVLTTAIMGAGLHFLYGTSRSLWVPMTVHLLNNSLGVLMSTGVIPTGNLEANLTGQPVVAALGAVALLLAAGWGTWANRVRVSPADGVPPGTMVPPPGSGAVVVDSPTNVPGVLLPVVLCAAFLGWLLFA